MTGDTAAAISHARHLAEIYGHTTALAYASKWADPKLMPRTHGYWARVADHLQQQAQPIQRAEARQGRE